MTILGLRVAPRRSGATSGDMAKKPTTKSPAPTSPKPVPAAPDAPSLKKGYEAFVAMLPAMYDGTAANPLAFGQTGTHIQAGAQHDQGRARLHSLKW